MIEKTVCFTGHRNIPLNKRKAVVQRLKTELSALINNGYQFFMAGGALGFDTIAAQSVLDLKKEYPHIKLILVLPCPNQTMGWKAKDKRMYEYIKSRADKVVYTSQEYPISAILFNVSEKPFKSLQSDLTV